MNICTKCGSELKEGVSYCKACGSGSPKQGGALDQKKARVLGHEKKGVNIYMLAGAAVFVLLSAWVLYHTFGTKSASGPMKKFSAHADSSKKPAPAVIVKAENGEIRVPLSAVENVNARFFTYSYGGKNVRFFVLRAPDGGIRAALDACTACYRAKQGYRPDGEVMICNNCGMEFRPSDIGVVTGGCNPIPLKTKTDNGMLVLKAKDLEAGAGYF